MSKLASLIRIYLRSDEYAEGLTSNQLAVLCQSRYDSINDALRRMPDAYIKAWVKNRNQPGRYSAVWCVVVPPENCPRPEIGKVR